MAAEWISNDRCAPSAMLQPCHWQLRHWAGGRDGVYYVWWDCVYWNAAFGQRRFLPVGGDRQWAFSAPFIGSVEAAKGVLFIIKNCLRLEGIVPQ